MTSPVKQSVFSGGYVKDVVDMLVASALSGQNAVLMSAPGYGKTDIAATVAEQIAGSDRWNLLPFDDSSMPSEVKGVVDSGELISNGRYTLNTEGTPYGRNIRIVVADELFRANDPVFNAMLHALDPIKQRLARQGYDDDQKTPCLTWATSNFVAKGEKIEAVLDRFGLWVWIDSTIPDVAAIVESHLSSNGRPALGHELPTWEKIMWVRDQTPSEQAKNAIIKCLENVAAEAVNLFGETAVNPRRLAQWSQVLLRCSIYYADTPDFSAVPKQAVEALRFAWPSKDAGTARRWKEAVHAMRDPLEALCESLLVEAEKLLSPYISGKQSIGQEKIAELGRFISNATSQMRRLADGRPRSDVLVQKTVEEINKRYVAAMTGNMSRRK